MYVGINELKPHEEIKPKKLKAFTRFVAGKLRQRLHIQPIWIDAQSKVILDGHHRYSMFRDQGCSIVPCIAVDYLADASIKVFPRRPDIPVTKQSVIDRGLSGNPYPSKTTKHVFAKEAPMIWVNVRKCR